MMLLTDQQAQWWVETCPPQAERSFWQMFVIVRVTETDAVGVNDGG